MKDFASKFTQELINPVFIISVDVISLILLLLLTRWVKLNDLNFDIINWSVKDKFIDILHQC